MVNREGSDAYASLGRALAELEGSSSDSDEERMSVESSFGAAAAPAAALDSFEAPIALELCGDGATCAREDALCHAALLEAEERRDASVWARAVALCCESRRVTLTRARRDEAAEYRAERELWALVAALHDEGLLLEEDEEDEDDAERAAEAAASCMTAADALAREHSTPLGRRRRCCLAWRGDAALGPRRERERERSREYARELRFFLLLLLVLVSTRARLRFSAQARARRCRTRALLRRRHHHRSPSECDTETPLLFSKNPPAKKKASVMNTEIRASVVPFGACARV